MAIIKDYLKNNFKENIKLGKLQFGVAQEIPSPEVAEILATSNYDWLFIDGEHGAHDINSITQIARTIAAYDMTPVVRVAEASSGVFKQLLDQGIQNIIIPKVESGEEARQIMYWASYPPKGNRGMGAGAVRAARYGRYYDYLDRIESELCILPQIESKKGIENLDAIATTAGIGGIFLGPIDLAVDMGYGLDIFHPEVVKAMHYAITRIKELGVSVGTIAVTPEQAKEYANMGVSFLGVGADSLFLANSADKTLETFKAKL
ncbi:MULTISPECIES: HpcH/HpaI aldolase family protein [unclassified Campylobacter]|uniref:HpcH/HpaI aldolase family protein n=1 Tax=unclassified Campylobacter TaxID=2593542 RepID=UPI003D3594D8